MALNDQVKGKVKFATSSKDPDEHVTLDLFKPPTKMITRWQSKDNLRKKVKGQSKKERQQPLHLNNDQQDSVIQWFQGNELLYDKGHCDYKLTEKKTALWKENDWVSATVG